MATEQCFACQMVAFDHRQPWGDKVFPTVDKEGKNNEQNGPRRSWYFPLEKQD